MSWRESRPTVTMPHDHVAFFFFLDIRRRECFWRAMG